MRAAVPVDAVGHPRREGGADGFAPPPAGQKMKQTIELLYIYSDDLRRRETPRSLFWLSDEAWEAIERHVPKTGPEHGGSMTGG